MLSRVAETLYWTARYIERADNIARLVNVNNLLLMDLPKGISSRWEPVLDIIGSRDDFSKHFQEASEKNVLKFLTVDKRNPSSILNCITGARDNMRTIRDVVPREVWEIVNRLDLHIKETSNNFTSKRGRTKSLEDVVSQSLLIFGTMEATMSHDSGYYFWRIGSALERADMTSRIIDVRTAFSSQQELPFENIQWISVLHSLSAYQMYRQRMGVRVLPKGVLNFMLYDEHFPRSIYWCLSAMNRYVHQLPSPDEMIARISHSIADLDAENVEKIEGKKLHDFIDELQIDFADIHDQLAEQYF